MYIGGVNLIIIFEMKFTHYSFCLVAFVCLLLFSGCNSEEPAPPLNDQAEVAFEALNAAKMDFAHSSTEKKARLWLEKLEQIKTNSGLDDDILYLLDCLSKVIEKTGYNEKMLAHPDFAMAAEALFSSIPKADLKAMFSSLEAYHYNGFDTASGYERFSLDSFTTQPFLSALRADNCNCRWMCRDGSSDCRPTKNGCGFLWLQSCTRK